MDSRPARSPGFSLIEVLITLFVVAVGLLGIIGLQAFSKKNSYDAVQRTMAAALAQDIIERMRANPKQAQISSYLTDATLGVSAANPAPAPGMNCSAASANCSADQTVAYDLDQWTKALTGSGEAVSGVNAGGLVEATGCITAITTASPVCLLNVTIAWRGVTETAGVDTRSGTPYLCGSSNANYTSTTGAPLRRLVVVQTLINC